MSKAVVTCNGKVLTGNIGTPTIDVIPDLSGILDGSITSIKTDKVTKVTANLSGSASGGSCRLPKLVELDLPNVTTLGNYAFSRCTGLTGYKISIPKLTSIGTYAFMQCTNLQTIAGLNPAGLTDIGLGAFSSDNRLSGTISLPKLTTLNSETFSGCSSVSSYDLPKVTSVGNSAFRSNYGLKTLTLPECITVGKCFAYCSNLETIILPKATKINNTSSGESLFLNCPKLAAVTLGASTVCSLVSTDWGKSGITVYVPESLIESYKAATY